MITKKDHFITVYPRDLWKVFSDKNALYRAGSAAHPRFVNLRLGKDLKASHDPFVDDPLILPNPRGGISFSDSIETMKRHGLKGTPWVLPKGKIIPHGLVFNYIDKTHPLLNVSRPMRQSELVKLLKQLTLMMYPASIGNADGKGKANG